MAALGGAALMWPLSARAQQPAPGKWRVAMLMPNRRQDVLRQGLRELGYVEGDNLVIEARSIERADRIAALAAELVGLKPDVIVATGTQATQAVQQATRSIPIVMTGSSDPVGTHLVASLAHPGGNVTGLSLFSPELSGKRMEMLRNVTGELSSLAVLWNPDDPPAAIALKETHGATGAIRLQIIAIEARNVDDPSILSADLDRSNPPAVAGMHAATDNVATAVIVVVVIVCVGIVSVIVAVGSNAEPYKRTSVKSASVKSSTVEATARETSMKAATAEASST